MRSTLPFFVLVALSMVAAPAQDFIVVKNNTTPYQALVPDNNTVIVTASVHGQGASPVLIGCTKDGTPTKIIIPPSSITLGTINSAGDINFTITDPAMVPAHCTIAQGGATYAVNGFKLSGPGAVVTDASGNPKLAGGTSGNCVKGDGSLGACGTSTAPDTPDLLKGTNDGTLGIADSGIDPANVLIGTHPAANTLLVGQGTQLVTTIPLVGGGARVPTVIGTPSVGNCMQFGTGMGAADAGAPCGGVGGPPTGAAGGDLTGTYPNPTIGAGRITIPQINATAMYGGGTKLATTDGGMTAGNSVVVGTGGKLADSGVTPGGLPTQSGQAGKILMTTGASASSLAHWGSITGFQYTSGVGLTPDGSVFLELGSTSNNILGGIQAPAQGTTQILTGVEQINPTQLAWGISANTGITLGPTGGVALITGTVPGEMHFITNFGTVNNITFPCVASLSTSKFVCPPGINNMVLHPTETWLVKYSTAIGGYSIVGVVSSGGPGAGLLVPPSTGIVISTNTSTGATTNRVITGARGIAVSNADGTAGNPTVALPTGAAGDLLVDNGSVAVALNVGAAGQVLTADPTGPTPKVKWATVTVPATPTTLATGNTVTLTAPRQYYVCTGGATCNVTPPAPVAGLEFCVYNAVNIATPIAFGAVTGSAYSNTGRTVYGSTTTGTLTSSGVVGDAACLLGVDTGHYMIASFTGTWNLAN